MGISIKIKRKDMTIFLNVEPSDTFAKLKLRLQPLVNSTPDMIQFVKEYNKENPDAVKYFLDQQSVGHAGLIDNQTVYLQVAGEAIAAP